MRLAPRLVFALGLAPFGAALGGCGDDTEPGASSNGAPDAGAPDAPGVDAGGPPCAPGEAVLDDGGCRAAGIPPEACADGFEPDLDGACSPILPAACEKGQMALPGETECRAVAPCGAAPWGDIPIDATTQFVDASYAGGASDGTQASPWTTIAEAFAAASPGATIAVAAGTYAEDVLVAGKGVVLWGRCPELVEIAGTGANPATVQLFDGADGTELHTLALTGPGRGVMITQGAGLVLDRLWIHDTGSRGINANDIDGATELALVGSLVESTSEVGVQYGGVYGSIEDTVVRGTVAMPAFTGRGINVQGGITGARPNVTVRRAIVEDVFDVGLYTAGADVEITATVVRDVESRASDHENGQGMTFEVDPGAGGSKGTVRGSVVERSRFVGVFVYGSELVFEQSVVRDTRSSEGSGTFGRAFSVQDDTASGARSRLELTQSVVARNREVGLAVIGSDAFVDSTVVRATEPQTSDSDLGRGIAAQADAATGQPSTLRVTSSVVEDSHDIGIAVHDSKGDIELTRVTNTRPAAIDLTGGRGVAFQAAPGATPVEVSLRFSLVETSYEAGVVGIGANLLVEGTTVRDSRPRESDKTAGRGVSVQRAAPQTPVTATMRAVRVEQSFETGIAISSVDTTIEGCAVSDTALQVSDGGLGDGVSALILGAPASVTVTGSSIRNSARAALSTFGASISVGTTTLECAPVYIDGETYMGSDFSLEDQGGNVCTCEGDTVACQVLSSGLAPPGELGASQDSPP